MARNRTLNDLKSRMDEVILSFIENPAKDYASYLERVGLYNGLQQAMLIVVQAEDEDDN